FELRLQEFTGGSNPSANTTPGTVHCTIAETGIHTLEDGRVVEARSINAPATAGQAVGWNAATSVDASPLFVTAFTNPVAMTGVITANDSQPSVVWSYDCDVRDNVPFANNYADGICVGKHIGQINGTRAAETIGIILINGGTGVSQGVRYQFFRGPSSINGIGTNASSGYNVGFEYDAATVAQMGEKGGQGGWATLVGAAPFSGAFITVSIDEEVVAGDTSRTHVSEEVNVYGYRDERAVALSGDKSGAIWDPAAEGLFSVPGADMAYTLTVRNTGAGAADRDTVFLVDTLPDEIVFYSSDFDPGDGDIHPVRFTENGTGLSFNYSTDVGFSVGPDRPASMLDCTDAPTAVLDPAIRFVCFNPKGSMLSGDPDPVATFEFRGRIR
ncbi:MAG: hypothetical protein AAF253_10765, partial [Pseudomonadota bacterium]